MCYAFLSRLVAVYLLGPFNDRNPRYGYTIGCKTYFMVVYMESEIGKFGSSTITFSHKSACAISASPSTYLIQSIFNWKESSFQALTFHF